MVSVIKTDKLIVFFTKKFLFFQWTLEESDLRDGNKMESCDFYLGEENSSHLQFKGNGGSTPFLYLHNPKGLKNSLHMLAVCDKNNSCFYRIQKTIDMSTCESIDLLFNRWNQPSSAQYPITISCTIKANTLCKDYLIQESNKYEDIKELCSDFKKVLEQEANTDIVLKVEEESIKAHKLVLEARSQVFRKMFTHDSKEAAQNKVVISDIGPATMKRLLRFLYSAEMEGCTLDELQELYYAADKYEVLSLKENCKIKLLNCISVENACALFTLANRHNDEDLKKAVVEFVGSNFKSVVNSNYFLEMNKEDMQLLMRLCSHIMKN